MNFVLSLGLEILITYILVFILYWLIFVRKKTTYDPSKVPVEFYYLVSIYRLDQKKINYKKFVYASAFINTFIIVTTYMLVYHLLNKWIWRLLMGIVIIVLLIIICYGILGRHYQKKYGIDNKKKRGKKNV